jgi:cyclic pyranopterin phosphate synthase
MMIDQFGRQIDYLRLSITQRCNLNCGYCGNRHCLSARDEMGAYDIQQLVKAFVKCGITKLRLTGGEPLLRKDLTEIISRAATIEGLREITATTNGVLLTSSLAEELKAAGLQRVNISLDSLKPLRYKEITGGGKLDDVMNGIDAALVSSLTPLHINVVLMKGINDDETEDFILYARKNPVTVRFIELMPFAPNGDGSEVVKNSEILARHPYLIPVEGTPKSQPSVDYTAKNWQGKVGFISPITGNFCDKCNRVRVLSDGSLLPCLGSEDKIPLMPFIDDEQKLIETIKAAIRSKPMGHHFERGCVAGYSLQSIGG